MLHLNRDNTPVRMRNYGRIIQNMVAYACTLPDDENRRELVRYITQCMAQKNTQWNRDQETGLDRINRDLLILSNNQINCDFLC